jgi:hypothetical protein
VVLLANAVLCYQWEKQVSSASVGDAFLKLDEEGVVQMNIRAISVVKQKYKTVSFFLF